MPDLQPGLESTMTKLSLLEKSRVESKASSAPTKTKTIEVAESWEDELSAGEDAKADRETETTPTVSPVPHTDDIPNAPPPTPMTPTSPMLQREGFVAPYAPDYFAGVKNPDDSGSPRRPGVRPEKTDAVARRMIAGALGVRPPKKTDESKEYEKAVREREKKRREQEKEAQRRAEEDMQRAKAAVWGD